MTAHLYYSPLKWKELAELVNQVRLGGVGLFPDRHCVWHRLPCQLE